MTDKTDKQPKPRGKRRARTAEQDEAEAKALLQRAASKRRREAVAVHVAELESAIAHLKAAGPLDIAEAIGILASVAKALDELRKTDGGAK